MVRSATNLALKIGCEVVKGSKVLRTRKVKQYEYHQESMFKYFCSNGCYNDFANANIERIVALAPRTEPLETPINDPVVKEVQRVIMVGITAITQL